MARDHTATRNSSNYFLNSSSLRDASIVMYIVILNVQYNKYLDIPRSLIFSEITL